MEMRLHIKKTLCHIQIYSKTKGKEENNREMKSYFIDNGQILLIGRDLKKEKR